MVTRLEYVWTVVTNIFVIVVTLAIFQHVSMPFEVFVVSGIVAIYVGIEGNMAEVQKRDIATTIFSNSLFLYLAKILKDPEHELLKEQLDIVEQKAGKGGAHYIINSFSRLITLAITAFYLVKALI